MPEVIEPPEKAATEVIQPQLTVKAGDKFREAFAKLEKEEKATEAVEKPVEPPKEEPKAEVKVEAQPEPVPEVKPVVETPKSPLDVVTADKKPETKPEEDVLSQFDEKTANWKQAREVMKRQSEEAKALKATLEELKKTPKSDPEEVARLTKEREDLKASLAEREELIKSVDVRLSDEYRTLDKKRATELGKIATRAKSYGVDPEMLVSAILLPESKFKTDQIKAIMAEVDPSDKTRLDVLIEKVDGINEEIAEFEKDAPKKYEEIQSKRQAKLQEQQEAAVKMVQGGFAKITDELPNEVVTLREVPEDVPGGTEWNQAIKAAKETALRVLSPGGSDFNESAAIAYKGAHYDAVMNMFLKEHSELLDARKRLAEYDSGGPDFKGAEKPKGEQKLPPGAKKYFQALETLKSSPTD